MLIQRRPSTSTTSTFGVSGCSTGATTSPRVRDQRRSLGFGTLGMGTSGLVGTHGLKRILASTARDNLPHDIAGHIQRGGGTGPMKPRQPPDEGKVPIPERCGRGTSRQPPPHQRRFFYGSAGIEVQGVCDRVPARSAVRV